VAQRRCTSLLTRSAKSAAKRFSMLARASTLSTLQVRASFVFYLLCGRLGRDTLASSVRAPGVSALHHACFKGNASFFRMLLTAGADVNLRDSHSQTPLANA